MISARDKRLRELFLILDMDGGLLWNIRERVGLGLTMERIASAPGERGQKVDLSLLQEVIGVFVKPRQSRRRQMK